MGNEVRQLTELVGVRFTEHDFRKLREEAAGRGVTVPELLRELALTTVRAAS